MSQDKRPWLVECPICDAAKNEPCSPVRFGKVGEETEVPHNKRYLAAGIDSYSGQPTAGPSK
jgi:hypothetical protein